MLAYIFWHRPFSHVDRARYEASMLRFQAALAAAKPPGFIAAVSFRIEAVPWLGDHEGYEDWCVLKDPGPWIRSTRSRWRARCRRRTTPLPRRWSKATVAFMPMLAAKRDHRRNPAFIG